MFLVFIILLIIAVIITFFSVILRTSSSIIYAEGMIIICAGVCARTPSTMTTFNYIYSFLKNTQFIYKFRSLI